MDAIFFDCDGTLVDSERLCSQAFVAMFASAGLFLDAEIMFERFKGVKLFDVINVINQENATQFTPQQLEPVFRTETARLFETQLTEIPGAAALLKDICVPMCIVSNGPMSKMKHSLGNTDLLAHFPNRLFSAYDIQRWKPDPALMYHAADIMKVDVTKTILVDDSLAGAQAGIAAGMQVYYFCADQDNPPIDHPNATSFKSLAELPLLWRQRGWQLTRT